MDVDDGIEIFLLNGLGSSREGRNRISNPLGKPQSEAGCKNGDENGDENAVQPVFAYRVTTVPPIWNALLMMTAQEEGNVITVIVIYRPAMISFLMETKQTWIVAEIARNVQNGLNVF